MLMLACSGSQIFRSPGKRGASSSIGCEELPHTSARIAGGLDLLPASQRRNRIEKVLDPLGPSRSFAAMVLENHDIRLVKIDQFGDFGQASSVLLFPGPLDTPVDRQSRSVEDHKSDALNAGCNAENAWLTYRS
jgi:hypothetical protein